MTKIFINIGNTWTAFLYNSKISKIHTSEFSTGLQIFDCASIAFVASVVPQANDILKKHFSQVYFLNSSNSGLDVDLIKNAHTIGADRLANALACNHLFQKDFLIIDCGSCITGELINSKGQFLGGFIFPGRQLQRNALHSQTTSLPQLQIGSLKKHIIGLSTQQAIDSGVDRGILGSLNYFVKEINQLHPQINICFTGGDGKLYQQFFDKSCLIEDLTLQGLKLWQKKEKS